MMWFTQTNTLRYPSNKAPASCFEMDDLVVHITLIGWILNMFFETNSHDSFQIVYIFNSVF